MNAEAIETGVSASLHSEIDLVLENNYDKKVLAIILFFLLRHAINDVNKMVVERFGNFLFKVIP